MGPKWSEKENKMHQKVVSRSHDRACREAVECGLKWGEVGTERGQQGDSNAPKLSTKGTNIEHKGSQN